MGYFTHLTVQYRAVEVWSTPKTIEISFGLGLEISYTSAAHCAVRAKSTAKRAETRLHECAA